MQAQEYDGSTPLSAPPFSDPGREAFCQELIAGEPLYAAYEAAGFKRPRGNAQRMLQEDGIGRRLAWLGERMSKYDEVLLAYRRNEHRRALTHIATADRLQLFEEKTGYVPVGKRRRKRYRTLALKPLDKLTADERSLIDGVEITDKGAVKVLMPKRLDARAMLAKLDGLDRPTRNEHTAKDGAPLIPETTDEQRVRAVAVLFAAARLSGITA